MTMISRKPETHMHLVREAHKRLAALYLTMSTSAGRSIELEGIERLLHEFLRRVDLAKEKK